jgi:hypothetical protein
MVANTTVVINTVPQVHAAVWTTSTDSWVDLHPSGATESRVSAVHNRQQAGWVAFTDDVALSHAALWTDTAESFVDIHPPSTNASFAADVHNGQQVGSVSLTMGNVRASHAALWTGTPDSWIDLNPTGATISVAGGVYDGLQVGSARFGVTNRAGLWTGTPESWELLPLPPGTWTGTAAAGVWSDDNTIYVVGSGLKGQRTEALLWTRPIPEPSTLWLATAAALLIAARALPVSLRTVIARASWSARPWTSRN